MNNVHQEKPFAKRDLTIFGQAYYMVNRIGSSYHYTILVYTVGVDEYTMVASCRTIEINLKEMLGETDLPPAIEARGSVLI